MALFNRDYDRSYGYRGGGRAGYDRGMGSRGEGAWDSMKRNTRDFLGMDNRYDRGHRAEYDRGIAGGYDRGGYERGYGSAPGYGVDYTGRGPTGGYDRPYWGYDTWRYDRNYKSREQTDVGDPFGDRRSGTPMRVMDEPRDRGGWFGGRGYDRGYGYDRELRHDRGFGGERAGYGRDFPGANPMGYDPYEQRGGEGRRPGRGYDAGFRNRGYDRDWF